VTDRNPRQTDWLPLFLVALVAALAAILPTTSSVSAAAGAETRVRASDQAAVGLVGPPEHVSAGQDRVPGVGQRQSVVATGVAANAGRRVFDIHPRVAGQLNDPRLGALRGKLSADDLQGLAHNPNATYLMDNATGHINVVQEVNGVILRITTPRDAFRIISVGRMRPNQIPNGLESGRFVDIGPGG
jgi:hypothetical protein